ncbi:hypothetical protein OCH7691_02409 [Oceanibacterium hippocampi]|uniref:Invasion associated locus B (IalB) protein n=1 Tax=Oceanibacterium hippocampi TaxID=745714 RepID=A0A1Y5T7X5_9PROT|nr:hypothetical protein OCH7691_02409 [Oceanibacterium hippocampi]
MLLFGAAMPASAQTPYVFFYRIADAWSVTCWQNMASGRKSCSLAAPRTALSANWPQNILHVGEIAAERFQVAIEVRATVMPGTALSIRVDDGPVREAAVAADSVARFDGEAARDLIVALLGGRDVVYRVQTAPDGMPLDMRVPLAGFREALEVYRGVIRHHGLIGG